MKLLRLAASVLALNTALLALPAFAANSKKDQPTAAAKQENAPEWAELFGDASLPVIWQSAQAASAKIEAALKAKTFEGVAAWAETVHLASHALEDQVKLDDKERQKRLDGALRQAAKLADEVLDAASHQEAEILAEAFRRMNAALQLAARRLPKGIVDAAPQKPRFAQPGK